MGSIFWGPLADTRGRKQAFIYGNHLLPDDGHDAAAHFRLRSLLLLTGSSLIILGGFVSAFCPNYASFIVCRAVVGFGVGGISVPFDLLAEYLPTEHRGRFLM